MPYCIGEIKGLKGTVAVKTLPDHINEDVITILQNDSPLNLAAGTRKINLKGGLYEAKVITLEGGNLALDLSMTTGGKDSVYAMTREMELLGGGDTIIYLMRSKPICGCYTGSAIKDGHLILDKNYTGIGGSAWNAGNRWILDLLCSVINHSGYPVQKLTITVVVQVTKQSKMSLVFYYEPTFPSADQLKMTLAGNDGGQMTTTYYETYSGLRNLLDDIASPTFKFSTASRLAPVEMKMVDSGNAENTMVVKAK